MKDATNGGLGSEPEGSNSEFSPAFNGEGPVSRPSSRLIVSFLSRATREETPHVQPHIAVVEIGLREPRIGRELGDYIRPLVIREAVSFIKGLQIRSHRPGFHLLERGLQILLQVGGEPLCDTAVSAQYVGRYNAYGVLLMARRVPFRSSRWLEISTTRFTAIPCSTKLPATGAQKFHSFPRR